MQAKNFGQILQLPLLNGLHPAAELDVIRFNKPFLPICHNRHRFRGIHAVPPGRPGTPHHGIGVGQILRNCELLQVQLDVELQNDEKFFLLRFLIDGNARTCYT